MTDAARDGLEVVAPGPLTTVQDEGRPGYAAWGVTRSGAADRGSYRLGNRLLGNPAGTASLEVTLGGLVLRALRPLVLAVTGAPCPGVPLDAPFTVGTGEEVRLGRPRLGLRSYVAVRGGVATAPVLGSRSRDTLAGLGPAPLREGDVVPVGGPVGGMPGVDQAAVDRPWSGDVLVRVQPGPRRADFTERAWTTLLRQPWTAGTDSDRVGLRLAGAALPRAVRGVGRELPSEGVLRGAVQVPPSGTPVVFLADHPVTGGYPVIAYVSDDEPRSDVDLLAQVVPGGTVRFVPHRRPVRGATARQPD